MWLFVFFFDGHGEQQHHTKLKIPNLCTFHYPYFNGINKTLAGHLKLQEET